MKNKWPAQEPFWSTTEIDGSPNKPKLETNRLKMRKFNVF